jgi:hypothetical protein
LVFHSAGLSKASSLQEYLLGETLVIWTTVLQVGFAFFFFFCTGPIVLWLVSAPFSMFVHQKVVRIPHNNAEAKKRYFMASD